MTGTVEVTPQIRHSARTGVYFDLLPVRERPGAVNVDPSHVASLYSHVFYAEKHTQPPLIRGGAGSYWIAGGDLRRPIRVNMSYSREDVLAIEPNTGIHGAGIAIAEAINDLRVALVEHLDVLERSGPLSADLQDQKLYLHDVLKPTS